MPSETVFGVARRPGVLVAGAAGALCVVALGLLVRHITVFVPLVASVNATHSPAVDALALALAGLAEPVGVAAILTIFCCIVAWRTKHLTTAIAASAAIGLTWLSTSLVKLVIERPRPDWALVTHHIVAMESNSSFPSAHVVFAASLATAVTLLAWHSAARYWAVGFGVAIVIAMASARIYVGVHDPIDVTAGAVYGISMTLLCWSAIDWIAINWVSVRRMERNKIAP
ncbi:MAG: phosphatase PAP2 family protein [Actinobacteria bacterium]|nr:phosphatase PAP2 family protein [Actinomycetota bacterium]